MTNQTSLSRRHLLKWTGAAGTVAVAGALLPNFGISAALGAELGDGDIGVLNYAYALEQLEAAFYTQVLDNPFGGMQVNDERILREIRDHEVAHRDFLKNALGGTIQLRSTHHGTALECKIPLRDNPVSNQVKTHDYPQ